MRSVGLRDVTRCTESPDLKTPMTMRLLFKEPSLFRAEADGGIITIVDGSQGKQLILDPTAKTALLLEGKAAKAPHGRRRCRVWSKHLRQLTEGDAKPVGEKAIGDIRALGYLVKKLGTEMTVWVDPATRLPIRIESSNRTPGQRDPGLPLPTFKSTPRSTTRCSASTSLRVTRFARRNQTPRLACRWT